jgi:hypothetical protein
MGTVIIRDEAVAGQTLGEFTLDFLTEIITVRELIERRVYEEAQMYNTSQPSAVRGLVQPADVEGRRQIDWRAQADRAIEAFGRNGFVIFVDDQQVESLDTVIRLELGTSVSFVKLVPLVGG